jgi:tetratricopeptide (TPR) repeat protein
MKIRHFICILAIALVIIGFAPPVLAAENQTTDAATNYYNIGVRYLANQDYQRALDFFNLTLASNTTMIQETDGLLYTYQGKAYALIQLTLYDEAIGTSEQGLALYPKDPLLWNDKGYALFKLGRYQDAVTAYDSAIGFDANYTSALINKGQALYLLGKYQDSADAYTRADATDPGNSEAAAGLAQAQAAAATASSTQTTVIILVIIVIVAAGGIVWFMKFRKPAEEKTPQKKIPEKKTKKAKKK